MADVYQVADGFNNAAGLQDLSLQPMSVTGWKYPEYRRAADGSTQPHGTRFKDLTWPDGVTQAQRNAVLTALGVSEDAPSNEATMHLQKNDGTWEDRNVTATYIQEDRRITGGWEGLLVRLFDEGAAT